jgi:hypothetical protein
MKSKTTQSEHLHKHKYDKWIGLEWIMPSSYFNPLPFVNFIAQWNRNGTELGGAEL